MKKTILKISVVACLMGLSTANSNAQTDTLYYENFEGGSSNHSWLLNTSDMSSITDIGLSQQK